MVSEKKPANPELPPRTRRIPQIPQSCKPNERNYLRVRGEYFGLSPVAPMTTELPPRALRILMFK